jgi:hypothetical protein
MFYDGVFTPTKKEFALKSVEAQFLGATYRTLSEEDRRRLDDAIVHATVVRQDEPSEDESSIYKIFERLNTGGVQLTPQEIRACVYVGDFSGLLRKLNEDNAWRQIFGAVHKNMRDQELILRFLALYFEGHSYRQPMKGFLNWYMGANRFLVRQDAETVSAAFEKTIAIFLDCVGSNAFRRQSVMNAAIFDSMMIGVAKRLDHGQITDRKAFVDAYAALLNREDYVEVTESSTSAAASVNSRIDLATKAFANIQ